MDQDRVSALEDVLKEAAHAHHEAFLDVDGADPEWPIWYAKFLQTRLSALLQTDLTQSRIVYELMRLDDTAEAGEAHWTEDYAKKLLKKYG